MTTAIHVGVGGARRATAVILSALTALLVLGVLATSARADFGINPATSGVTLSTSQAGAHADLSVAVDLNRTSGGAADGDVRDIRVSLPPGFWGSPNAFDTCSPADLANAGACPAGAQVGTLQLELYLKQFGFPIGGTLPLYNLTHGPDVVAAFGANIGLTALLKVKVRSDDFGLDTVSLSLPVALLQIAKVKATLFGVPADHNGSGEPRRPFMTNPSSCDGGLQATLAADSWENPGSWDSQAMPVPDITGCDRLPKLEPSLTAGPVGGAADTPSGYDVDLTVPQSLGPDGLSVPTVKNIAVAFPEGVAISPAAADGLQACTDEQLGAGKDGPPECPNASKVGSVSIDTPALAVPLEGDMYLGQPRSDAPYRLFLVASAPGVMLKLRGVAHADERTGQITTVFEDTPALPFSRLHVHLKGGPLALLANPIGCGTFTSSATLTPYGGGEDSVATSDFTISADGNGGACGNPMPFGPALEAGVTNPVAGAASPFTFRLTRADGQRELGSISSVHLPAGLIGDVSSVPLCPESAAATATCPAGTRIGSVEVGSGAGAHPLYLPGDVYLTGPYKGAPFGLAIVVNAIAGPYDLGTVNVRAAVKVNPDASLSVEADPLPTILQGIPLRLRDIALSFDRPGFMLNPTSCAPATITASAVSVDGVVAPLSNRFQVGDCAALGYRPKLSLALTGRDRSGVTGLTAHIATRPGDANSRKISVELPAHVGLNVNNAAGLCTTAQFDARSCPANSIVGHASVDSILHVPLTGPVYFVQGQAGKGGNPLPRLFVPLTGEGVTIDLVAQTTLKDNRIVTTFDPIPDVPFTTFDMTINGGAGGILGLDAQGCSSTLTSLVQMDGYNGKLSDSTVTVPAGCPLHAVSKSLSKRRLTLKVSGLGAGTLRVSGAGIRAATRSIGSATVASISTARTRASAPARVKVTFDPAGPAKAKSLRVAMPANV